MTKKTKIKRSRSHYVWVDEDRRVLVPGDPTRVDDAVSWVGWHLPELAGVLAPAAFALVVTPWAWLVSGLVTAGWTAYEVRQAREQAAIRAGDDIPHPADADAEAPTDTEPESDVDTGETSDAMEVRL